MYTRPYGSNVAGALAMQRALRWFTGDAWASCVKVYPLKPMLPTGLSTAGLEASPSV